MDEILKQLGELVLGSVPTMVLFILLVWAYGFLVRRPLDRVLTERRLRTTGAMEQAHGAIAAAEAETTAYEEKLRAARAAIFKAREQRLKLRNEEREAALAQVRQQAQEQVRRAKQDIEGSVQDARVQIEDTAGELSARIMRAVLPADVPQGEVAR